MQTICKACIIPVVLLLLTGCWDQNIYEKVGFVLNTGIDLGSEEGKALITFTYPIISNDQSIDGGGGTVSGGGDKVQVMTHEAYLVREARELNRMSSDLQLECGKVQSVFFGRDFAEERGISEYLETYERNTQLPVQAWVIIVDGSASELITKGAKFKNKPRLGVYINELLSRNSKAGYCANTNIIEYDIKNNIPGLSPIVPMIKLEGDEIEVTGTALIDRDRMTGQLNTFETACLYLAMGETKLSEILFDLPQEINGGKKKGIIYTRKVKTKSKIEFREGVPELHFDIRLKAILDEYTWGNITDPEYKNKVVQSANNCIKECLDNSFKKLQAAKCDALGIGDRLRAFHYDYWRSIGEQDGWREIYPEITVTFNVETKIIRFGEIA